MFELLHEGIDAAAFALLSGDSAPRRRCPFPFGTAPSGSAVRVVEPLPPEGVPPRRLNLRPPTPPSPHTLDAHEENSLGILVVGGRGTQSSRDGGGSGGRGRADLEAVLVPHLRSVMGPLWVRYGPFMGPV